MCLQKHVAALAGTADSSAGGPGAIGIYFLTTGCPVCLAFGTGETRNPGFLSPSQSRDETIKFLLSTSGWPVTRQLGVLTLLDPI